MAMMMCGHEPTMTDEAGDPICKPCYEKYGKNEIHLGSWSCKDAWKEIFLGGGRISKCVSGGGRQEFSSYCSDIRKGHPCKCEEPSSPTLPFFRAEPEKEFDQFYCGCYGWD